jgi:molecular chaperone GrpE (heat shock protein)
LCKKLHSDSMKEEFEQSVKNGKDQGLYRELERYLQKIVDDVDNKIRAAQKRVEEIESKVLKKVLLTLIFRTMMP